jgi:hypothetical protein
MLIYVKCPKNVQFINSNQKSMNSITFSSRALLPSIMHKSSTLKPSGYWTIYSNVELIFDDAHVMPLSGKRTNPTTVKFGYCIKSSLWCWIRERICYQKLPKDSRSRRSRQLEQVCRFAATQKKLVNPRNAAPDRSSIPIFCLWEVGETFELCVQLAVPEEHVLIRLSNEICDWCHQWIA